MKRIFISAVVIIAFIAYSIYHRATKENLSQTPPSTITSTPTPTSSPIFQPTTQQPNTTNTPTPKPKYKDGTYTGDPADAFYGMIQVQTTITNGRITNIKFLQYPNDRGLSIEINKQSNPILAQEAIQAQSANIDIVSGATDSSNAFIQSLTSSLDKAKT